MISAFFAWWFGQLAELLPSWLRRPALTRSDALVIAPAGAPDRATIFAAARRRGGRETPLGEFELGGDAELNRLPTSPRRPPVLRLPRSAVLEKTLTLPLAAEGRLDQVLAFEMDRETPFSADEVYWNYRVESVDRQQGRLSLCLTLIPKSALAGLLPQLTQAGIAPKWIEIADAPETPVLPLDSGRGRPEHGSQRLVWAAAACCVVLALGALAIPFARQAATLAALDREVRAGQAIAAEADALRGEIDRLSRGTGLVRSAREKTSRPLEVLATVTRLLPDDTYLTEFELRQRKVTLGGRSAGGAARLIGVIAGEGMFRNPAFSAPVTRIEALRTEVFTIAAEVGAAP